MKVIQFEVWPELGKPHYCWRGRHYDYQPKTWHPDQQFLFIYGYRETPHDGHVVSWLGLKLSSRLKLK